MKGESVGADISELCHNT